jgi:hypothetical protein
MQPVCGVRDRVLEVGDAERALCMREPDKKKLVSIPLSGKFAKTALAPRKTRAPLLLVLTDGTKCSIRDGGAWGQLKSHPKWYGTYACEKHGVVWSPPKAHHYGIDESAAVWTVRTGPGGGKGKIVVRRIRRVYFVGTASS